MDELIAMKGPGRCLMALVQHDTLVSLVRYADGSMAIHKNDSPLGLWEYPEAEECLDTFARMAETHRIEKIVLLKRGLSSASPALPPWDESTLAN